MLLVIVEQGVIVSAVAEARSTLEAVQQLIGISWSRFATLIGPVVASLWIYVGLSTSADNRLASPLTVAADLLQRAGLDDNWTAPAGQWFAAHEGLWLCAVVLAASLGSLAAHQDESSGAWLSIAILMLMIAVQLHGLSAVVWFVLATIPVLLAALVLDFEARRDSSSDYDFVPSISIQRWIVGPAYVIWFPVLLPLFAAASLVQGFRVERPSWPQPTGAMPVPRSPERIPELSTPGTSQ